MSTISPDQALSEIMYPEQALSEILYTMAAFCRQPSDINEHLPTLMSYAARCNSVIEAGVRYCVSSYALSLGLILNGNKSVPKKKMISIDLERSDQVDTFEQYAKQWIDFNFWKGSDLDYPLTEN